MAKGEEKLLSDSEAWKSLEDLFGSESVVRPDQTIHTDTVPTGTPSLDRAIGIGGWPRGRLIQLAGAPSSGKTLLALIAMANWQAQDPENCVAFIDAEYTYSAEWAAKFGVDNDRVYLVKTNEAAKAFAGLVGRNKKNQQNGKITKVPGLFDMIKSGQTISYVNPSTKKKISLNCGKMGVIVLDSIANLQVPQEVEAEVGKALMAAVARFLTVELKKLTPGIAEANVAMIAINQVRVNPGEMWGNPECVDPFTTKVKIRYNKFEQEITVNELLERFVRDLDYNRPSNTDVSDLNIEIESFDFDMGEKNKIIGIREVYIKLGKGGVLEEVINEIENASCKCKVIRWRQEGAKTKSFYLKNELLDSLDLNEIKPLINEKSILLNIPEDGLVLATDTIK